MQLPDHIAFGPRLETPLPDSERPKAEELMRQYGVHVLRVGTMWQLLRQYPQSIHADILFNLKRK